MFSLYLILVAWYWSTCCYSQFLGTEHNPQPSSNPFSMNGEVAPSGSQLVDTSSKTLGSRYGLGSYAAHMVNRADFNLPTTSMENHQNLVGRENKSPLEVQSPFKYQLYVPRKEEDNYKFEDFDWPKFQSQELHGSDDKDWYQKTYLPFLEEITPKAKNEDKPSVTYDKIIQKLNLNKTVNSNKNSQGDGNIPQSAIEVKPVGTSTYKGKTDTLDSRTVDTKTRKPLPAITGARNVDKTKSPKVTANSKDSALEKLKPTKKENNSKEKPKGKLSDAKVSNSNKRDPKAKSNTKKSRSSSDGDKTTAISRDEDDQDIKKFIIKRPNKNPDSVPPVKEDLPPKVNIEANSDTDDHQIKRPSPKKDQDSTLKTEISRSGPDLKKSQISSSKHKLDTKKSRSSSDRDGVMSDPGDGDNQDNKRFVIKRPNKTPDSVSPVKEGLPPKMNMGPNSPTDDDQFKKLLHKKDQDSKVPNVQDKTMISRSNPNLRKSQTSLSKAKSDTKKSRSSSDRDRANSGDEDDQDNKKFVIKRPNKTADSVSQVKEELPPKMEANSATDDNQFKKPLPKKHEDSTVPNIREVSRNNPNLKKSQPSLSKSESLNSISKLSEKPSSTNRKQPSLASLTSEGSSNEEAGLTSNRKSSADASTIGMNGGKSWSPVHSPQSGKIPQDLPRSSSAISLHGQPADGSNRFTTFSKKGGRTHSVQNLNRQVSDSKAIGDVNNVIRLSKSSLSGSTEVFRSPKESKRSKSPTKTATKPTGSKPVWKG